MIFNKFKRYIRYRKRLKVLKSLGWRSFKGNLILYKDHRFPIFKEDILIMSDISFNQLYLSAEKVIK